MRLASFVPGPVRRAVKRLPGFDMLRALLADKPKGPPPESGSLRPVVYLPTWVRWDAMRQRPQYVLAAFAAAGHPVYFVDPRETGVRRAGGVTITGRLRAVPREGVILYVHFAPLRHLFDRFDDPVIVYDVLDDLSIYEPEEAGLPEERKVRAHHPHVVDRAALVMVSNQVLAERHRSERPDLMIVENGVDPEVFGVPVGRPDDLPAPDPGRPLIGYHGMISTWFDFELLEAVATTRLDWRFVLVGPVDHRVRRRLESLTARENVSWLDERPSDAIPGYVQAFDVGVIWFVVDHMTSGVTPLKMYEYLAAGTPCVATPLPACVAEPTVVTAGSPEEMVAAIAGALGTDASILRAAAHEHSWSARLQPVLHRLDELDLRIVPQRSGGRGPRGEAAG